jgi:hypothetical protein
MNRSTTRRVVPLALVLFALALPVAAQPAKEPVASLGSLLSTLRELLSSSLLSIWEKTGASPDPLETAVSYDPTPPPPSEGRGMIDPDG